MKVLSIFGSALLLAGGVCLAFANAQDQVVQTSPTAAGEQIADSTADVTAIVLPDIDIDREVRRALEPGVLITFHAADGEGKPDARRARLPAFFVSEGEAPSAFVAAGPFVAKIEGYLKLKLKTQCDLSLAGNGTCTVTLNGQPILRGEGDLGEIASKRVELGKYSQLRIDYESPKSGAAELRLYWASDEFAREPVPSSAAWLDSRDPRLADSDQLRLGREQFLVSNCHKCHGGAEASVSQKNYMPEFDHEPPSLKASGQRFQQDWMVHYILNPRRVRNHVTMPALFAEPESAKALDEAVDIAAFLGSLSGKDDNAPAAPDPKNAPILKQGEELYEQLGCIACHVLPEAEDEEDPLDRISLRFVAAKFQAGRLVDFLAKPRQHYPWSRMPDFRLSRNEALALAAYIRSVSDGELAPLEPTGEADPERGRVAFITRGCANCHETGDELSMEPVRIAPLDADVSETACLGSEAVARGDAPDFGLSEVQRDALIKFVEAGRESLGNNAPAEAASRQLKQLRCVACHRMDSADGDLQMAIEEYGSGKVLEEWLPNLTFVGERVHADWLQLRISGKLPLRARPWLKTRMPSYPARAEGLANGLAAQHGYGPTRPAKLVVDAELAEAGRQLIEKEGGFDCVQCHGIGDREPTASFEARGINFAIAAKRVRGEFFDRWMLDPQRFDPASKMPRFASDGKTTAITTVYDGDARRQFHALWHHIQSLESADAQPQATQKEASVAPSATGE